MKFKKTTLPNGLRIITVPAKDNPAVTVLVVVEAGSNYEDKNNNGISHFIEHMCFKGTIQRPRSIDIAREIDSLGAQNNAFTGNELTGYYAKAEKKHFKKLLEILSDLYLNPTFPEPEMEKEKGVILQELSMYEDLPQKQVVDNFFKLVYGDTPAGRKIIGTTENIKKFKRDDFIKFRDKHYVANGTVVIVSGNINEKEAVSEVKKYFKNIPTGKKFSKEKVKTDQTKPGISIQHKKTDQAHLIMGFKTFSAKDPRNYALALIVAVLGKGMSSRLFQRLREDMGVCYYVQSWTVEGTDHGFFAISAGVDKKRVTEVVKALTEECKKLTDELVPEAELKKAKDNIVGKLYLNLETSDSLAEFYAEQEIVTGKLITPQELENEIRKITTKDVQKIAKSLFKNNNLNLAIVGDIKDKDLVKKALRM